MHTHTHTQIYIYIYIYIKLLAAWVVVMSLWKTRNFLKSLYKERVWELILRSDRDLLFCPKIGSVVPLSLFLHKIWTLKSCEESPRTIWGIYMEHCVLFRLFMYPLNVSRASSQYNVNCVSRRWVNRDRWDCVQYQILGSQHGGGRPCTAAVLVGRNFKHLVATWTVLPDVLHRRAKRRKRLFHLASNPAPIP